MKNRAKCKKCNSIIESFHEYDYVGCKCGEIAITGGNQKLECFANDWKNFLRVDENGNEILVKVKDVDVKPIDIEEKPKPTKAELIDMLDEMIRNIEGLPKHGLESPVNHYDLLSSLLLVSSILRSD